MNLLLKRVGLIFRRDVFCQTLFQKRRNLTAGLILSRFFFLKKERKGKKRKLPLRDFNRKLTSFFRTSKGRKKKLASANIRDKGL